jgi:thiol-disulfide isomerase/thioredoxin
MQKLLLSSIALFALVSAACADEEEKVVVGEDEDIAEVEDEGQAAPETELSYPAGPYGEGEGSIIRNMKFRGYARPQDGNFSVPQTLQMADFYNPTGSEQFAADSVYGARAKPKALLVIISAAWCGPCKDEARLTLPGEYADYAPMGAEFLTVMAENVSGDEPELKVLESWQKKYAQNWPGIADGQFKLFALAAEPAFPANILIDTRTMTIVDAVAGADPAIFSKMEDILSQ